MKSSHLHGLDKEVAEKRIASYDAEREEEARRWITQVTGIELGPDFVGSLKSGVVLCTLANAIQPNVIPKFTAQPKHYLEEKANLNFFIEACRYFGVPESDLSTLLDFSDAKRDDAQILQNIFALGRQAQAIGFPGPILGPKYSMTREQQLKLEGEKEKQRQEQERLVREYEEQRKFRREFLEDNKAKRHSARVIRLQSRRLSRRNSRQELGRTHLKKNEHAYADKVEDDRSPSPVRYGMDLEWELRVEMALQHKHEEELEEDLMNWIEDVTGYQVDSLFLALRSGVLLCELVNKLMPGTIKYIAKPKSRWRASALPEREEDIAVFLSACRDLGIRENDLFNINDLYEKKNMAAVKNTLMRFAGIVTLQGTYSGPQLTPRTAHRPAPIDIDAEAERIEAQSKFIHEYSNDVEAMKRASAPIPTGSKNRRKSTAKNVDLDYDPKSDFVSSRKRANSKLHALNQSSDSVGRQRSPSTSGSKRQRSNSRAQALDVGSPSRQRSPSSSVGSGKKISESTDSPAEIDSPSRLTHSRPRRPSRASPVASLNSSAPLSSGRKRGMSRTNATRSPQLSSDELTTSSELLPTVTPTRVSPEAVLTTSSTRRRTRSQAAQMSPYKPPNASDIVEKVRSPATNEAVVAPIAMSPRTQAKLNRSPQSSLIISNSSKTAGAPSLMVKRTTEGDVTSPRKPLSRVASLKQIFDKPEENESPRGAPKSAPRIQLAERPPSPLSSRDLSMPHIPKGITVRETRELSVPVLVELPHASSITFRPPSKSPTWVKIIKTAIIMFYLMFSTYSVTHSALSLLQTLKNARDLMGIYVVAPVLLIIGALSTSSFSLLGLSGLGACGSLIQLCGVAFHALSSNGRLSVPIITSSQQSLLSPALSSGGGLSSAIHSISLAYKSWCPSSALMTGAFSFAAIIGAAVATPNSLLAPIIARIAPQASPSIVVPLLHAGFSSLGVLFVDPVLRLLEQ